MATAGSVNIADAAMQTAVCVVVNAPTTNMVMHQTSRTSSLPPSLKPGPDPIPAPIKVEIIDKLLLDEKMQKKPKACACSSC